MTFTDKFADSCIRVEKNLEDISRHHWSYMLESERIEMRSQVVRTIEVMQAFFEATEPKPAEAKCTGCTETFVSGSCPVHRSELFMLDKAMCENENDVFYRSDFGLVERKLLGDLRLMHGTISAPEGL